MYHEELDTIILLYFRFWFYWNEIKIIFEAYVSKLSDFQNTMAAATGVRYISEFFSLFWSWI